MWLVRAKRGVLVLSLHNEYNTISYSCSRNKLYIETLNKNMCFVTIASTGNATDFADLLSSGGVDHPGAASANHGGIS